MPVGIWRQLRVFRVRRLLWLRLRRLAVVLSDDSGIQLDVHSLAALGASRAAMQNQLIDSGFQILLLPYLARACPLNLAHGHADDLLRVQLSYQESLHGFRIPNGVGYAREFGESQGFVEVPSHD